MSEWVLVPVEPSEAMSYAPAAGHAYDPRDDWAAMLAARPPIPRSVWDAMVERGARGLIAKSGGNPDEIMHDGEPAWRWYVSNGNVFLRAALGNPSIEETYEEWRERL